MSISQQELTKIVQQDKQLPDPSASRVQPIPAPPPRGTVGTQGQPKVDKGSARQDGLLEMVQEPKYINEADRGVRYLGEGERSDYLVTLRDETLHRQGQILDTNGEVEAFVIGDDGSIYIGEHIPEQFHHSSFLAGAPVKMAGMIKVKDGKVTDLDAQSGHYKPHFSEFRTVVMDAFKDAFAEQVLLISSHVDDTNIKKSVIGVVQHQVDKASLKSICLRAYGLDDIGLLLKDAIKSGNNDLVNQILASGFDVNQPINDSRGGLLTALDFADTRIGCLSYSLRQLSLAERKLYHIQDCLEKLGTDTAGAELELVQYRIKNITKQINEISFNLSEVENVRDSLIGAGARTSHDLTQREIGTHVKTPVRRLSSEVLDQLPHVEKVAGISVGRQQSRDAASSSSSSGPPVV